MTRKVNKIALLIVIGVLGKTNPVLPQNEVDALRYSTTYHGGTARYMSMGGAFSALGSDISSSSVNPAGLGLYRSSDLSYTMSIDKTKTSNKYLNQISTDNNYKFNSQSMGAVFSYPNPQKYDTGTGQINMVIGLSFNRITPFNQDVYATGRHDSRSYLTHITDYYNQNTSYVDNFWRTGLLFKQSGLVTNDFDNDGVYDIKQTFTHTQQGSINDINFSAAFNESNKLYYGISIGIVSIKHKENINITESDDREKTRTIKMYSYDNSYSRIGIGLNFKAGVLYQASPMLKLSLAAHTPTILGMEENWDEKLSVYFDNSIYDTIATSYNFSNYSLVTPARTIAGASIRVADCLLIGLDYETAAYQTMSLDSDKYSFSEENQAIEKYYTWRHVMRIGAEYKLGILALRTGTFYYTSPFKGGKDNMTTLGLTAGIGIRTGNFYTDFAFQTAKSPSKYYIDGSDAMLININKTSNSGYLTFGYRF